MSAVRRLAACLCASLLAAACGGTPLAAPVPTAAALSSPAAAPTNAPPSTPTSTAPASPTPRPSPLVSAKGDITVTEPLPGDRIASPLTIAGQASVFEGTLGWRIVTSGGTVLGQGSAQASVGAPLRGAFTAEVSFEVPAYGESGFVEVFERSPKDGSIADIARVPVGIPGSY